MRRPLRWALRTLLVLVALATIAVSTAIIFIHTNYGREQLRAKVDDQLALLIAGGGHVGKIEGSVFGELVLRDVVINGPDRLPVLQIKTLRLKIHILELLSHRVRIDRMIAEDVQFDAKRDAGGRMELGQLLVQHDRPSPWTIDIAEIEIQRGRFTIDSGTTSAGIVNLDDVALTGNLHIHRPHALEFALHTTGTWRERAVPIAVDLAAHDEVARASITALVVQVGEVAVFGQDIELAKRDGKLPIIGGRARIVAPHAAVAKLVPGLNTREDLTLAIVGTPVGGGAATTAITIDGVVGTTAVHAALSADVDTRRAVGTATVADFDLAVWTNAYAATVAGDVAFDIAPGAPGDYPTAHATVRGRTHDTAETTFEVELATTGRTITIERASLIGSSADPARVTNGAFPLHGAIDASLTAHGTLAPEHDLAITGSINGKAVRYGDLAASTIRLAIDATQLPDAPKGQASLVATGATRGATVLGDITANAANRADGKLDVAARVRQHGRGVAELAAIVTPPGRGDVTTIDLVSHHLRAGEGRDWSGTSGRVVIDPRHIVVTDLRSASPGGAVAIAGTYTRGDGDVTASVTAHGIALAPIAPGTTGMIDVHADVARQHGLWRGTAEATATALALQPGVETLDGHIAIDAKPGTVLVTASASGHQVGSAKLALDLAAPQDVTDLAAWRARGRTAIRRAELTARALDLGQLTTLARQTIGVSGRLDGTLAVTPTTATGDLHVRGLVAPGLERVGPVDGDLMLAQTAAGMITPALTVRLAGIGTITARGDVTMPARVFDPDAWRTLGPNAVHGATISLRNVAIDPGLLARFGIDSQVRGRASVDIRIAGGLRSIAVTGDLSGLRGTPIARPVNAHIEGTIDGTAAHATLSLHTEDRQSLSLVEAEARIPVSIDQLRRDPDSIRSMPLTGTVTIAPTSAPVLFAAFGHTEVTGGEVRGSATIAGTIRNPMVVAHVLGEHITVPPGPHGKPIKSIDRIAIDATWDEHGGKLTIDGDEPDGGKLSVIAHGNPLDLRTATAEVHATRFDLGALLAFAPGPAGGSAGILDANFSVTGFDLRSSKLTGELHLANARVPIAPTVGTLRDAKVDITIHEHDIKIVMAGKLGAGTATLDGSIALDGASLTGGNAKLTLRKVSPIGTIEPIIDADVTAKLSHEGTAWKADLVVDNGTITVPEARGEKLKPAGIPSDVVFTNGQHGPRPAKTKRPPTRPILVVNLTLHNTRVVSDEVRTLIHGTLQLTADGDSVGITGTIEGDRGDIDLFDRRYQVERAVLNFDGSTDPLLDIRIVHDFPDVETITQVRGRLSKPRLELSSNPGGYTKGQLLGFLIGGEPGGDPTSASARDKVGDAGTSLVANKIGGYIKKALPFDLDVIRYEAAGVRSSSAITVGSWVTHTLFFAFRQHLTARPDENSGEGTLEYWITRRLEIEGVVGDRGYDGIDLLWRKRF